MSDLLRLTKQELTLLIADLFARETADELLAEANLVRQTHYGKAVFLRGLIEISSYCVQNCYYCGLRHANKSIKRYRLTREEILSCCELGAALGFHTFVLQGGEDPYFNTSVMCDLIGAIRMAHPGCAITVSLGEKDRSTYQAYFDAGANRYLLRHETASAVHFARLHPAGQTLVSRKHCLYTLREIGFQVGAGFMVGSPGQTADTLAEDLLFLRDLQPHMVGIGPYIPQKDTPFRLSPAGRLHETLIMIALTRLMLPKALMPATTALASIAPDGRQRGLAAGANVVMPNLSPPERRGGYAIYDDKAAFGTEAAEGLAILKQHIEQAGYVPDMCRGDALR